MLCPSCNKFAAYDTSAEPEVEMNEPEIELDEKDKTKGTAHITGTCRIVLTAECCGDELKESNFEIDLEDIDVQKVEAKSDKNPDGCTCAPDDWIDDVTAEGSGELTERQETTKPFTYKTGPNKGQTIQKPIPYRYQRKYYGAQLTIELTCACGKLVGTADWSDEIGASSMDELV